MDEKQNRSPKNRLRWIFESTMAAAAFAEAGDVTHARELLEGAGGLKGTVLLVTRDAGSHCRSMNYAVELCRRLRCRLSVLHLTDPDPPSGARSERAEGGAMARDDIPCSRTAMGGPPNQAVARFLKENRRVVSVVMDDEIAGTAPPRGAGSGGLRWWRRLGCPVVLVENTDI